MVKNGLVILLDGVSSAGKTVLATHLGKILGDSVLLSVDAFILRKSNRLRWFLKSKCLRQKPDFLSVAREFHREIECAQGRHDTVIVDTILLDDQMREDLLDRINKSSLLYVQVYCPLNILEERERNRESRQRGAAQSQFDQVYGYTDYDLKLDTSKLSKEECAQAVLDSMQNRLLKNDLTIKEIRLD